MTNFLKTILTIMIVSIALAGLSLNTKVSAAEKENLDLESNNIQLLEDGVYYDKDTGKYFNVMYHVIDGKMQELTIEEYIQLKNAQINDLTESQNIAPIKEDFRNPDMSIQAYASLFTYKELSKTRIKKPSERVSVIVKCPYSSCSLSISYSTTKSQSFSQSLGTSAIKAIQYGASFTWTTSASVSSSATHDIPKGYEGWWEFAPYYNKTYGTLIEYNDQIIISQKPITAYSPIKMGGVLDGVLTGMLRKL